MSDYNNGYNNNGYSNNGYSNNSSDDYDPAFVKKTQAQHLSRLSFLLGMGSLIFTFFMTVIIPYILAPVSIVLAVISKSDDRKISKMSRNAVILSVIALVANTAIVGTTYYSMFTNPELRQQVNSVAEQMYGYSLDDLIEAAEQETGIDLDGNGVVGTVESATDNDDSDGGQSGDSYEGETNNDDATII